jgi:hypothetical protein
MRSHAKLCEVMRSYAKKLLVLLVLLALLALLVLPALLSVIHGNMVFHGQYGILVAACG